jgi:hypothetical protein
VSQRESGLSRSICQAFRRLGANAWAEKIHASVMGNTGLADLWLAYDGLAVCAETKALPELPTRGASMALFPAGGSSPSCTKIQLATLERAHHVGMRAGVFLGAAVEKRLWWLPVTTARDGVTVSGLGRMLEIPREGGAWVLAGWWETLNSRA